MKNNSTPHTPQILCYHYKGNIYINLTSRCTLMCTFCPKRRQDFMFRGMNLEIHTEPEARQVVEAVEEKLAALGTGEVGEVVFAGLGEPTMALDTLLDVARSLKKEVEGLPPLRVITDGLASLRAGRDVTGEMAGVVDKVSVSLNAADGGSYQVLCPSAYGADAHGHVVEFIRAAASRGIDVTATIVAPQPGVDVDECARIVDSIPGARLRVRPLEGDGFAAGRIPVDMQRQPCGDPEQRVVLERIAAAVNGRDLESLSRLFHPQVMYEAALAGFQVSGREAVVALFRQGIDQHQGRSRLGLAQLAAPGQGGQPAPPCRLGLIWWEPVSAEPHFAKRGFLTFGIKDGEVLSIRDSHDAAEVEAASGPIPGR